MVGAVERVDLAAEIANVAVARQTVRRWLSGLTDPVVGDVELIVSELVTNAIDHGPEGSVVVEVDHDDSVVRASVTSAAPSVELPSPDRWALPTPDATSGRGLAIVRRLADDVQVDADDERLTIVVTVRLDTST